jgi:hypothetical protein
MHRGSKLNHKCQIPNVKVQNKAFLAFGFIDVPSPLGGEGKGEGGISNIMG